MSKVGTGLNVGKTTGNGRSTIISGIANVYRSFKKDDMHYLSGENGCERISERRLHLGASIVIFSKMKAFMVDDCVKTIEQTKKPDEEIVYIAIGTDMPVGYKQKQGVYYFSDEMIASKSFETILLKKIEAVDDVAA